jgi:hypothetical protein
MNNPESKHAAVAKLLDALRDRLGAHSFAVVDHWPDDPLAIGITSPKDARVLAYVAVNPGAEEPYFVSLELPPEGEWVEHPYLPGDERNECGLDELVFMIDKHLGRAILNS